MATTIKKIQYAATLFFLSVTSAQAAAFYIQEQSSSGLGTAFAGAGADTRDASTIYYNPAGMTDLKDAQMTGGATFIIPDSSFKNRSSTVSSLPGTGGGAGVALSGRNGGNPFDPGIVPHGYIAAPVNADRTWWGGIGVSAPFGLENKYDKDFIGRYDSVQNQLQIIDFSPSVAYAPNRFVSLGFGFDIQNADAMLKTAVPSPITAGGPTPTTDGLTNLSGDDTKLGFNAGIIVKPQNGTRLGLHYRQGVPHTLKGRLITRVPSDVPGVGGTYSNVSGQAELDLPSIANFDVSQEINDRLTLLAGVSWYKWSNFDDIPVGLATGASSDSIQNYEDTWGFSAGARYRASDRLMLKAGMQYDPTPTVDNFRSTRIPDGDRTWLTAGASYEFTPRLSLDFAAAYVNVSKEKIDLTHTVPIGAASTTYNIHGDVEGSVGIISTALTYKFGAP